MGIRHVIPQLLTPVKYLLVKGVAKSAVDYWVPLLLAAVGVPILLWIPASILGAGGLIERVNQLLQVLVGFYVASVAAVSSIPSVALDQNVKNATLGAQAVSRRRFLSLLFGYLSLLGLTLYIGGVVALLAGAPLKQLAQHYPTSRTILIAAYSFVCWHMVCVTLLSLRYLVDQAYCPDPIVNKLPPESPAE